MPYVVSLTGSAGDSAALGTLPFQCEVYGVTLEAWIKTSTSTAQTVLSGSGDGGFVFFLTGNQLQLIWTRPDGKQLSFQSDPLPATLADTCWHHVAVSMSFIFLFGGAAFYVDGKAVSFQRLFAAGQFPNQTLQVQAGAPSSLEPSLGTFNGELTDLRIWSSVQDSGSLQSRYRGSIHPQASSLVGYWPLSQGELRNQAQGGGSAGTLSGSATVEFDTDPAWYPLSELICNVPGEPFPAFSAEAATAYQSILSQLSTTDLRARYLDLDAPISTYQAQLASLTRAPSVPEEVWRGVIQQLNREMTAVLGVWAYFHQLSDYLDKLHAGNQDVLNNVGQLVNIQEQVSVSGNFLGLISSLVSGLSAMGDEEGQALTALAGMLGAMSSLQSAGSGSSSESFQVEYAELWGQLDTNFQQWQTQASQQEQLILQDWGRLRATQSSASIRAGMSWPVMKTEDLVQTTLPLCQLYYAQLLVPIIWQLYELISNNPLGGLVASPSQCSCLEHSVPDHAWRNVNGTAYVIAGDGELDDFPTPALMDLLFRTQGIAPASFFTGGFAGMGVNAWNCCNTGIIQCSPGADVATAREARLRQRARHPEVQAFLKEAMDTLCAPPSAVAPARPARAARARATAEASSTLGPPAGSGPATMLFLNGAGFEERHIFYRGTDNNIDHVWRDGQGLHPDQWTGRGAPLAVGAPAAVADASGQHLFYRSVDGNLEHVWFDGAFHNEPWTGGPGLAPMAASDPAAVLVQGHAHVLYRGTDDRIYHCWREGKAVKWEPCMGSGEGAPLATGNPAAVGLSTLDVFYREKLEGDLYHLWFDGTSWQSEQWAGRGLGSPESVGDPAVALVGELPALQLFYRDSSGNINHVWKDWIGPQWEPWGSGVPPQAEGDPVTMVTSGGVLHVFYRGGNYNNDIIHIFWDGTFHQDQWTGLPDQPPATGKPATLVSSDGQQHVFYRGTDEGIYHVWFDGSLHWKPWASGVL